MKRAFYVQVAGEDWSKGVTAAESPAQAKHNAALAAREAGYKYGYERMRARRAPAYDLWAEVATGRTVWSEKHIKETVERARPASA